MSEPVPDAQRLFEVGRRLAPPLGRKDLLRKSVMQVVAGAGLGTAAFLARPGTLKLVLFKALLVVLVSSSVVGTVWVLGRTSSRTVASATLATSVQPAPLSSSAQGSPEILPAVLGTAPASVAVEPPKPAAVERQSGQPLLENRSSEPIRRVVDEPASPPAADDLRLELELLSQAQQAMNRGEPERALQLLEAHETRFPASRLAHERRAERIFALCALGTGRAIEGRAQAVAFLTDFPKSPFVPRVVAACNLELRK